MISSIIVNPVIKHLILKLSLKCIRSQGKFCCSFQDCQEIFRTGNELKTHKINHILIKTEETICTEKSLIIYKEGQKLCEERHLCEERPPTCEKLKKRSPYVKRGPQHEQKLRREDWRCEARRFCVKRSPDVTRDPKMFEEKPLHVQNK